jgi:hypothetical protein
MLNLLRNVIPLVLFLFPLVLHSEEKLFLYSSNYATPQAREINLEYRIDYNKRACVRCGVTEEARINNIQQWLGLANGVTRRLTLSAFGIFTYGIEEKEMKADSFYAGGKYRISEQGALPVDIALTFGYLQETGGISVLQAGGVFSKDIKKLNITSNVLFEKAFQEMRDAIDMFITAGISFKLADWLRAGFEYAGQDLEDLWEEEEAEGGARHIIGPVCALNFNQNRTQVLFTPAIVFSPLENGFMMRAMFSQSF